MNVHFQFLHVRYTDMKHLAYKSEVEKAEYSILKSDWSSSGAQAREKGVKCCGGGGRFRGAKKRDEIEDFSHLQSSRTAPFSHPGNKKIFNPANHRDLCQMPAHLKIFEYQFF